jgi:hypothetical protein
MERDEWWRHCIDSLLCISSALLGHSMPTDRRAITGIASDGSKAAYITTVARSESSTGIQYFLRQVYVQDGT